MAGPAGKVARPSTCSAAPQSVDARVEHGHDGMVCALTPNQFPSPPSLGGEVGHFPQGIDQGAEVIKGGGDEDKTPDTLPNKIVTPSCAALTYMFY